MKFNENWHSEKLGLKSYTIVITLFLFLFAIENISSQNTVKHILTNDQKSTIEAISSLGMIDDQVGMAGNPIIQLDLNGNGQLDYVTAAHASGLVFVFFDLPDFVNPTYSPSNGPNLIINGALGLGSSFASGDINGDGKDDLLLGAKNQGGDGEAYVIYGNSSFPTTGTVSIQVIKNIKITCSSDGGNSDLFGDQVATLDLNGDNYDDLLIGATHAWYEGDGSGPGDVYVIFGGPAVNNTIQARTQSNVILSGGNQFDHIGKYVGKGNFNNDGYEDLVFSSAYWPGAGTSGQRGKIWILFGSANPSGSYNTNNTYSNMSSFEGPFLGDEMCYFENGDINGDGVDDLLMAAGKYPDQYNTGIVYIAYGPIAAGNTYNPATYPNKTIIKPTINSNWTDAKFGQSIAVSDVNNDGFDDMLIGGPGFSRPPLYYGTTPTEGAAWLIYGSASLGNIVNPDTEAVITFYGDNQNQIVNPDYSISFGRSVNIINSNNGKHYAAICDVERNKIRLFECPDYSSYRFEANCNSMQTFTTTQTDPPRVVISDFNGDGKKDIIACGNQGGIYKSYFYTNNGMGGFSESVFSTINFRLFDIIAIDYDNDLDNDLFITGITSQGVYVSKILKNNGNLNFTDSNFSLEGLGNSSIDIADFNNDGFRDLVLTGKSNAGVLVTRIYINNLGSGFSLLTTTITGTEYGEVKCADFTGDGRADIFICGATTSSKISELYINNLNNTFSLNNGVISTSGGATISLRAMSNASAAWGDLDLDGDLDLLVSGYGRNPFREYTKFYRNNGNGNFTDMYYDSYTNEKISGPILTEVKYGSVAIVDINNDNALDVLLVGEAGYASFTKIQNTCVHLNNGNGKFSQNFINDFEQVQNGYIGAADFDNDGDKEIVVIGQSATGPISRIYNNKIINGIPKTQTLCNGATISNLVAAGSGIKWYSLATGGTVLSSTTVLEAGNYYVTQSFNGCESTKRTAVSVLINTTPPPTATSQTFCNSATVSNLVCSGTDIKWYSVATGGTALTASTNIFSGTYYVSQTISGCESSRLPVSIIVTQKIIPTFNQVAAICSGTTMSALPTLSNNTTQISGTWAPALNNQETTVYLFTPDSGQCAFPAILEIIVNQQPVQPTLACYQTATFNNATCSWDVTGTQPVQPTLACYQTAVFNTTSCTWDVTGAQPTTETTVATSCGMYIWETGNNSDYFESGTYSYTENCVTHILELTVIPSSDNITTITACDIYAWNGTVYTTSGIKTGTTANCVTEKLDLTINNSTSSVETVTSPTCGTYTWSVNSTTYTTSGTYTSTGTNAAGCPDTKTLVLTINPCESIINLKLNIQGYYDADAHAMRAVMANQGVGSSTTDVDDVTVELRDSITNALVVSTTARLKTDGTATATFVTAPSGSFYIAVKHRNAIQTWSSAPQTVGATPLTYDFTTAANKAYGDNMIQLESGVYGFYSGDLNQDEAVDIFDFPLLLNDNDNFSSGYLSTDLNGDGAVDIFDFPLLLNNNDNFIYSSHP